jgi:hypothetical protein
MSDKQNRVNSDPKQGAMEGFCEQVNEPSSSMRVKELVDWLIQLPSQG